MNSFMFMHTQKIMKNRHKHKLNEIIKKNVMNDNTIQSNKHYAYQRYSIIE